MTTRRTLTARSLATALLAAAGLATVAPARAGDIGVSIGFSQPGVYGRVDIGHYPQPVLIAPQPVVIGRPVYREPVYLWVQPDHLRDLRRLCYSYGACGAPVYFVEDGWYRRNVIVYREQDRDWRQREWRERDDWRDRDDWRERPEHGRGRGRGHDHHRHRD